MKRNKDLKVFIAVVTWIVFAPVIITGYLVGIVMFNYEIGRREARNRCLDVQSVFEVDE